MNNDELLTAVRDSFTGVHSATPVEQIVRRRAVRTRRRVTGLAGVLAVTAAAAVAVTTLLPGHQPNRPATTQLTAWTVTKQANGDISVTLHKLRDPAGLQRTLRVDGVPATVTFFGKQNPACVPYPHRPGQSRSEARRQTIIMMNPGRSGPPDEVVSPAASGGGLVIDPSYLPSGVGLQIGAGPLQHIGRIWMLRIWAGLVQASQQCTGS